MRELEGQQTYYQLLLRQHKLQEQDAALAEKQFQRETELFKEHAISALDYENAEKQVLVSRRSIEQSNISISNAQISVEQLEQRVTELDLDYEDKLKDMQVSLQNAYEQLKARISIWEQQYVMRAQVDGIISFNSVWSVNHQVNAGEKIFAIIPEDQGALIGKINLPVSAGYGKVKIGQNVNIKLDGYPYMEFGMIKGEVTSISLIPTQNRQMSGERIYTIEVSLPNGLIKFYNRTFDFTGELSGIAEISTDELSVLERFVQPIKFLFKKNIDIEPHTEPRTGEK
ncbi:MAG: HlyD family secretion protein [Prevotellaceae bacterium]|nr:HlyD family secretion protein [Prevotellaceae bacterium]